MTPPQAMLAHAVSALNHAYAPYSNYKVGACLLTDNGDLISGCNVENCSFSHTQCAETNAIGTMISRGQRKISEVLIVNDSQQPCPPCGGCLQRIAEFAEPNVNIHLCTQHGDYELKTLAELLPHPFNAKHLGNS